MYVVIGIAAAAAALALLGVALCWLRNRKQKARFEAVTARLRQAAEVRSEEPPNYISLESPLCDLTCV